MSSIIATYQVTSSVAEIERLSRGIALEQTVEVPEQLVKSKRIRDQFVGKVLFIEPLPIKNAYAVTIRYNADLASFQLPQLLNLIFGNISIQNYIRLKKIELPTPFLEQFRGPQLGVDGLRDRVGVYDRPLLTTALKPRGATDIQLARTAYEFALGGGDIIKDDHNLVDRAFSAFQNRVLRSHEAVAKANAQTGRNSLYFPNLCYPSGELEKRVEWVAQQGIPGVLVSPMVIGLDVVRALSERYPLAIMAHPTFAGTFFHDKRHGIEPGVLLGTLFRLAGVDISVFPNHGGRFHFTQEECDGIVGNLTGKLGTLKSALPAPAGGMSFDKIPVMARQYGADFACLCGGALLSHSENLRTSTTLFRETVNKHYIERLTDPQPVFRSSCEIPGPTSPQKTQSPVLRFKNGYQWEGRERSRYKKQETLPFSGVSRCELLTASEGEETFDLRYFEIAPGGYTSLEKHVHTHTIISVRGKGTVLIEGVSHSLKPHDVARVPPLVVHQVRNNNSQAPFGFFCIVNHERDRPQAP